MSAALQLDTAAGRPALVIAEWDRNAREIVRVALDQYKGRHTIDVRVWYCDDSGGALKPGRSGITLALKHLPDLSDAMAKALAQARQRGLLDEGGVQ